MNLNVTSSTNFGERNVVAKKSPSAMVQASEKIQAVVKRASNGELMAAGNMASAGLGMSLVSKLPYIAGMSFLSNSALAVSGFVDSKFLRKLIASKDSLIQQANEQLQAQAATIEEKDNKIAALEADNQKLEQEVAKKDELLKLDGWKRYLTPALWS